MHVSELDHDCLLMGYLFSIFILASNSFSFSSTFLAPYVMVCYWLSVVRAMMFDRGIICYSKMAFWSKQTPFHKKQSFFHWWTAHLWVERSRSEKARTKRSARSANARAVPGCQASTVYEDFPCWQIADLPTWINYCSAKSDLIKIGSVSKITRKCTCQTLSTVGHLR